LPVTLVCQHDSRIANRTPAGRTLCVFFLRAKSKTQRSIWCWFYFILFLIQADELLGAYRSLMSIVKSLSFTNTTFLSDCQQLVEFLNQPDLTHPPDWRMKCFTQIFHNSTLHQQARIFKIDRRQNTTADSLARQAFSDFHLLSEPTCSYMHQQQQCPLMAALNSVLLQDVLILSASCC